MNENAFRVLGGWVEATDGGTADGSRRGRGGDVRLLLGIVDEIIPLREINNYCTVFRDVMEWS